MKRWILANVAFIASSLVAAGSVITEEDLGKVKVTDPETGKQKLVPVKPPHDAIEIDAKGNPKDDSRAADLANLIGSLAVSSGAAAAPAQTPGGVSLAANQLTPAITAGHANLADTLIGQTGADPTHGLDPTVGNLSPEVIASLTANPEFMAAMAAALGTQTPPVVEQAKENAQSDGGKPAAGANAQAEAPKRRGDAEEKKG